MVRQSPMKVFLFLTYASITAAAVDEPYALVSSAADEPAVHRNLGGLQPRVTVVEKHPATKEFGSLSMAKGSPWCEKGQRMIWFIGHQKEHECPLCEVSPGKWLPNEKVLLDTQDKLNARDGDKAIDRHDCVAMDVNKDGRDDIICGVGADSGAKGGTGYNELYLTQEDGTLKKVLRGEGLQKWPSMRNRRAVVVKGRGGDEYVFFAVKGNEGTQVNVHRMFLNNYKGSDKFPWFQEVQGPWKKHFEATCAIAAPLQQGNKFDGIVVCNKDGRAMIIKQGLNRTFRSVWLSKAPRTNNWRGARVRDMDGDGKPDLVVTTFQQGSNPRNFQPAMVYVFRGDNSKTIFDFNEPMFSMTLPNGAPDVEIVDANKDGRPDIYVVQMDENKGSYCGPGDANRWWGGATQPRDSWVPPRDKANDLLLVGTTNKQRPFRVVRMQHSFPGCGFVAERFGNRGASMVLGQGDTGHAGYNLLLEW